MKAWNRRRFIECGLGMGAVAGLSPWSFALAADCKESVMNKGLGVQSYMIRQALGEDVIGTLEALAETGCAELELFGFGGEHFFGNDPFFGLSLEAFVALIERLGIRVPSAHVAGELADLGQAREYTDALGIRYLIEALAPELMTFENGRPRFAPPQSKAQIEAIAIRLNRRGEQVASIGRQFAYHNHSMEFRPVEGEQCMEIMVSNTDPDLVKLELDLGWIAVAGLDPLAELNRYQSRVIACHMKDYDPRIAGVSASDAVPIPEMQQLVPPGSGTLDFAALMQRLDELNVSHRFVEVDVSADPLADARSGLCHLAGL